MITLDLHDPDRVGSNHPHNPKGSPHDPPPGHEIPVMTRLHLDEDRFLPGALIAFAIIASIFAIGLSVVLIVTIIDRLLHP